MADVIRLPQRRRLLPNQGPRLVRQPTAVQRATGLAADLLGLTEEKVIDHDDVRELAQRALRLAEALAQGGG